MPVQEVPLAVVSIGVVEFLDSETYGAMNGQGLVNVSGHKIIVPAHSTRSEVATNRGQLHHAQNRIDVLLLLLGAESCPFFSDIGSTFAALL